MTLSGISQIKERPNWVSISGLASERTTMETVVLPSLFNCSRPLLRPHLPAVIHRRRGAARRGSTAGASGGNVTVAGEMLLPCVSPPLCACHMHHCPYSPPCPRRGRRLPIDKRVGGRRSWVSRKSNNRMQEGDRMASFLQSFVPTNAPSPFPSIRHLSSTYTYPIWPFSFLLLVCGRRHRLIVVAPPLSQPADADGSRTIMRSAKAQKRATRRLWDGRRR